MSAETKGKILAKLSQLLGRDLETSEQDLDLVESGLVDSMAWFDLMDGICRLFDLPDGALDCLGRGDRTIAALAAAADQTRPVSRVAEGGDASTSPRLSGALDAPAGSAAPRAEVRIVGWGLAVPEGRRDGASFVISAGLPLEEIERRTGISTRATARDAGEVERLAGQAASLALRTAVLGADRVDAIVVTSESLLPSLPGLSWRLHAELGLRTGAMPLDLPSGCAGVIPALQVASALLRSGVARSVLLVAVEGPTGLHVTERLPWTLGALLGDAAAAIVLERSEAGTGDGVRGLTVREVVSRFLSDRGAALGYGLRGCDPSDSFHLDVAFDGEAVARVALDLVPQVFGDLLGKVGWDRASLSRVGLHQPNGRLAERLRERLHLTSDVAPDQVRTLGNLGTVSALAGLLDGLRPDSVRAGDRLALVTIGAGICVGAVALEAT